MRHRSLTQRSTRPLILWRSWRSESEGLVSLSLDEAHYEQGKFVLFVNL